MKKFKKFLSGGVLSLMLACLLLAGCNKEPSIELSVHGNVYEVTPGGSLQINYSVEHLDADDLVFELSTTSAQINEADVFTVDTDVEVGTIITVVGRIGNVKSNTISINVVDLVPTEINLNASNNKIAKGGGVDFSVAYIPTWSTIKDYTLAVTGGDGADYVTLSDNRLTIKDSANNSEIIGKTVEVTATLNGHSDITSTATITIVDAEGVYNIVAKNVNYLVTGASKSIEVIGYNEAGDIVTVNSNNVTYSSSDEEIAFVQSNGKITAKGHGKTTVTINYAGKTTTCDVYVMIPATSISLTNVSKYIAENKKLSYSKADPLNLQLDISNPTYSNNCTTALTYSFELLDDDYNVIETGDSVATVNDSGINFQVTGLVRVKVSTNTSLNGVRTTGVEKSLEILVNVNNGINISTVAQFKEYANQENNAVANILCDIELTETENFGVASNGIPASLKMYGDRIINGNGYVLSLAKLPLGNAEENNDFLIFNYDDRVGATPAPFTVEIYNFEVLGNGGINGVYTGSLSEYAGTAVVNASGKYIKTYRRGIKINGGDVNQNDADVITCTSTSYVDNMVLEDVKVTGFDVGIRMSHVVDGLMSNVYVANCFSNGIESSQNIMNIHNLEVGKVGAFGLEVTPDDMVDAKTENPRGTAGRNYNETSQITFSGSITSGNYTNGADTIYLQGLKSQLGMSINEVLNAVSTGTINAYTQDISDESEKTSMQTKMNSALADCLYKKGASEQLVNLHLLIFVNKGSGGKYANFDKGNTPDGSGNRTFLNYAFDSTAGDMISVSEIMANIRANANYTGYKAYKYICIDLQTGSSMKGNIGQCILVNESYNAN